MWPNFARLVAVYVPEALKVTLRTALHMPAQHRRAARHNGPRRRPHVVRESVALRERRIALLEDLLERDPCHTLNPALRPPSPADAG
jgi:hypothetical protein